MRRMQVFSRIAAVIAVATGAAGAYTLPAGADVGIMSPPVAGLQIGSPATLGARGAVVNLPVTVLCQAGGSGSVSVQLIENAGGSIARGNGFANTGACNGTFQSVTVTVTATTVPFRRGTAFASGEFTVCDSTGCLTDTDQREIRIVR